MKGLKLQGQRVEKLSIASNKSDLLSKLDFFLKSGFQVIMFFIVLEVGYHVTIVVSFIYKWAQQLQNNAWLVYILEYFPSQLHYGHVALLFFTIGHQSICYQILRWQIYMKINFAKFCQIWIVPKYWESIIKVLLEASRRCLWTYLIIVITLFPIIREACGREWDMSS